MQSIGAVKSMLLVVSAGLPCFGVFCCLGFAGTSLGGVLVFLISLPHGSLACLFLLWGMRQRCFVFVFAGACRLAFFSRGVFAFKLLLGGLLGFSDLFPTCLDCRDCCTNDPQIDCWTNGLVRTYEFQACILDTSGVWPGSFLQPQHKGVRSAAGSVVGGFTGVGGLGVGGWRLAACRACDQLKQIAYERLATKHLVLELLGLD